MCTRSTSRSIIFTDRRNESVCECGKKKREIEEGLCVCMCVRAHARVSVCVSVCQCVCVCVWWEAHRVYDVVGLRAVADPIVGSSKSNMRTDCMSNNSCSAPTCDDPTLHLYMYVIRRGMNELTNFMQKLVKYLEGVRGAAQRTELRMRVNSM